MRSDRHVLATPRRGAIPIRSGIGLRHAHYAALLATRPELAFLEVHAENHFSRGGPALDVLERVREHYALSLHGVGLSLGSADPLSAAHLDALAALVRRFEPAFVSEHLCWSSVDGAYYNDLLPLPYTRETLAHVAARIERVQDRLGRRLAIENVSSYVAFPGADFTEWDFIAELVERTGCALLLDVNNVFVSAVNHGFDPVRYVDALPADAIVEIHLAGFTRQTVDGEPVLVDTHAAPVAAEVWALYDHTIRRIGPRPTLIEWDAALPPLATLLLEARRADCLMELAYDLAA